LHVGESIFLLAAAVHGLLFVCRSGRVDGGANHGHVLVKLKFAYAVPPYLLSMTSLPAPVLAKGREEMKGVGPTPVDQMHRPKVKSSPSYKQGMEERLQAAYSKATECTE